MNTRNQRSRSENEATTPRRLYSVAGLLAVLVAVVWWPGCRQYPPATSRDNLDLIKLVYTACNTRSEKRLDLAERRIDEAVRSGEMSPEEETSFRKIVGWAKEGRWQAAEQAAFRFAQDQIGQQGPGSAAAR